MRRRMKRVLSCLLAIALVFTSVSFPTGPNAVYAADAEQTESVSYGLGDAATVTVDGTENTTMQLYLNGVYETELSLIKGTHTIELLKNGEGTGLAKSIRLEEDTDVYVRFQDGVLYDSVNDTTKFHTASLVGNFYGLEFLDEAGARYDIASWAPGDDNAKLSYAGGGIYTKTFKFNAIAEDVTLGDGGYKVAFDEGWDYSIGSESGGNVALTIPAGTSELTVFVDEVSGAVYDSIRTAAYNVTQNNSAVTYPAFTMNVSLIGSVRQNDADNWAQTKTGYELTQISDTLFIYQMVMPKGSYEYKTVFNYSQWYEKGGNVSLSVKEDNTLVTFLYDASDESLVDSVNANSEVALKLGFEEAPAESEVTTNDNGTTTFVTAVANESDNVKLVYAQEENVNDTVSVDMTKGTDSKGNFNGTFKTEELFFGDEAVNVVYYYTVNGTKTLDVSAGKTTIDGKDYSVYTRAEFTGRVVNVPGTFPGNSWDAASNEMTYLGEGLYSYTFKDVPAANYEFKISMGSWTENYGVDGEPGGSNYAVAVTEKQDVTVYYTDLATHRAVTSIDYVFADVTLTGRNVPANTKLSDAGLTGIYSCKVGLPAGTYSDIKLEYNDKVYDMNEFSLEKDKEVMFYFDPSTEIYYNNSSDIAVDADSVYYDSKDTFYKSVFGAMATGEEAVFSIKTGKEATAARLIVKGKENKTVDLTRKETEDGFIWSGGLSLNTYGEYQYFFVLYYGSSVKIYCDDDGYYGTGILTDLTSLKAYDLVVYKDGYQTPDWMKNAVIYQIFPDRFYDGDTSNDDAQTTARGSQDYEFITNWATLPENPEQETLNPDTYPENAYSGDGDFSNEMYGGDLAGITERIDYLKAVGVNVIYLNPVFASISSHRYDTTDYSKVDPLLGDLGDFTELVKVAEENYMHIVLDGVFNHVSDDSIYFDRYYKFVGQDGKVGAYPYWAYVYDYMNENEGATLEEAEEAAKKYFEAKGVTDFSYTGWFEITNTKLTDDDGNAVQDTIGDRKGKDVYGYSGWWGYESMPVVMSTNGSEYQTGNWADTIINGKDSVTQYWLSEGSSGWRLDVANEVSDETWQRFRESVKSLSSDYVVIGEIWDDATEYLLGDMYDSVMNYVFRDAVLSFAKGGNATDSMNELEKIRERYPKEAYYAMMNLVGSHDTTRVLSYLDGIDDDRNQKEVENAFPSYETTSDAAKQKQYLVALIQMTYPGAPTIYYGDEIGMTGADDPDDRRAMTWGEGSKELVEWYATLAKIRSEYSALSTGDIKTFEVDDSSMAYVRSDDKNQLIVVTNNLDSAKTVELSVSDLISMNGTAITDLISGTSYQVNNGMLTVDVPAYSGVILSEEVKEIIIDSENLKPAYDGSYIVGSTLSKVTLDKTEASLTEGETLTLKETVTPSNAADITSTEWTSSNDKVATVKDGVVTAVAAGTATITVKVNGVVSATCKVTVTAKQVVTVDKVIGLKTSVSTTSAITLSWNKVSNATGYEVYRYVNKKWTKVKDVTVVTYKDSGLIWSTTYSYKVRAYAEVNGKKVYGSYSSTLKATTLAITNPVRVSGVKTTARSTTKVRVSWNKVSGATGYQVYVKTNNGTYKRIKTITKSSTTAYTVSGLTEGCRYSFKVRAYKTVSGKNAYGQSSVAASIRMGITKPSTVSVKKVSSSKVKVSWKKVSNIAGYQIYMKTGNGSYKKVSTVKGASKQSYVVTGLKKGKSYTFRIRSYKVVDGKMIYSKYTTAKKFTLK